jgi:hypothetical protein
MVATSTPNVRIPTGPLVARGSAPLGGLLVSAAIEDDPAPAIDRFEGTLTAFLAGLSDEDDLLIEPDDPETVPYEIGPVPRNAEQYSEEEVTVAGISPGNLRLVGVQNGRGMADDAEAAVLLASIPSSAVEVEPTDPAADVSQLDLVMLELFREHPPAKRVTTWASAAFGVTLGLTLGSGAYFQDALDRIRKSLPGRGRRRGRGKPEGRSRDDEASA